MSTPENLPPPQTRERTWTQEEIRLLEEETRVKEEEARLKKQEQLMKRGSGDLGAVLNGAKSMSKPVSIVPIVSTQPGGVRVIVDVGGTPFSTSLYTLEKYPDSMFANLLAKEKEQLGDESIIRLFVDRDPTHFRFILNYMRDGSIEMPENISVKKELYREAKFYNLSILADSIDKDISASKKVEKQSSEQKVAPAPIASVESSPRNTPSKKALQNVEELMKMLDHSHKLRQTLESEINSLKSVLDNQKKEALENNSRSAKEIVELKNQIEQHVKNEKKLQAQRDKMAEEMKKIEEEIELLKNVIEKQKERIQANQANELLEEEKKAFERQKRHLEAEVQDLKEQLEEKDTVISKQKVAFENELQQLRQMISERNS